MADTRENILLTALHLFARDGYEAVSVSTIAGALGMTKGALYKHFANKRDIFDCIVQRMYEIDETRSKAHAVPAHRYADSPQEYAQLSTRHIRAFTVDQFRFWTEDPFASDFRKMLTLEQYRSEEMQALYSSCLSAGPTAYMADIFAEMLRHGALQADDPQLLAAEYYAPLYLLLSIADAAHDTAAAVRQLEQHIARFFRAHLTEPQSLA